MTAVIDIAVHEHTGPVTAEALTSRHKWPHRHVESVLRALVRWGVLKGKRGALGGYRLARDPREITADEILRAVDLLDTAPNSAALPGGMLSALEQVEDEVLTALRRIKLHDLVGTASRNS